MEGTTKILYGDPSQTTVGPDGQPTQNLGYLGTKGRDAMDQRPSAEQQLEELRGQLRENLPSAESQLEFDDFSRRFLTFKSGEIGAHADQQSQAWYTEVERANGNNAIQGIQQNPADQTQVDHYTAMLMQSQLRTLSRTVGNAAGPDVDAMVNNILSSSKAAATEAQIDALIPKDPARAQQLLDGPGGQLLKGPRYDALSAKLETAGDAAAAQNLVFGGATGIASGGGQNNPGNIRVPGSTGTGPGAFQSFATPEAGYAAMAHQIDIYQDRHGLNTLAGIVSRWAPPTENDTSRLISSASAITGLDPNQPINVHDPATRLQVMTALAANEHGGAVPNPDALRSAAGAPNIAAQLTQDPAVAQAVQTAGPSALDPPGLTQKLQEIQNADVNPRAKLEATRLAIETYNARYTDQERARTLREQQTKDASDKRAGEIVTDAMSPNPTVTATQIGQDPALTWETKLHLVEALKKEGTPGQEAAAYGPGFWSAYQGIAAPPGDPSRITDQNQILRRAGPGGDLTLAGVEKLNQTLAATKRPEAAGDTKMQAGALAYARHQLSFEADYGTFKVRDPKGEDAFNIGFTPAFFKYWQDGIAAGKTPAELDSKDQIDRLVQPFKRTPAELMKDQLGAGEEVTGDAGAGKPDLSTQQGLKDAVRGGQISREQGEAIALKNGWISPSAPPSGAVAYLRANPNLRTVFDQKYGAGAADKVLGGAGPQPPIVTPAIGPLTPQAGAAP
jgi:hypothetical protein